MADCHAFRESLERGEAARNEPFWLAVYQKAFPGMVAAVRNDCRAQDKANAAQYAGIDRWVCLSNGKTMSVDEKVRDKDYGDILLEYTSNDRTCAPGWMEKDLAIDWLAYAIVPSRKCYLFSWPMLRRAWLHFGADWREKGRLKQGGFRLVEAPNPTYNTLSVAVPRAVLMEAVQLATIIVVADEVKP